MIQQWKTAVYTKFYQKCRPEYCTFTYDKRHDVLYMITTIIGFFGGSYIILQLISPLIIKFFYRNINIYIKMVHHEYYNREPEDCK